MLNLRSLGHVWMWELDCEESWAQKNWCFWTVVLEKTLESPLDCKEIQPVHPKGDQSWVFSGRTDAKAEILTYWNKYWKYWNTSNTSATWCEELTHWKRPWCWEGLGAGGERDDRGWDGWMASSTWWTWIWVNSGSWWWTGRPGVPQFMGLQRVRHNWATELNWTESHLVITVRELSGAGGPKFRKKNLVIRWKFGSSQWALVENRGDETVQKQWWNTRLQDGCQGSVIYDEQLERGIYRGEVSRKDRRNT